ncbi:MAG: tetratricopeptide repeat protein [Acidobacteriota bacterium]|nr:tetratricopeptide repeat protein [Acidobacteriota bacterium]
MTNGNPGRLFVREVISSLTFGILALTLQVIVQAQSPDVESAFAHATQLHESGDLDGAIRGYQAILVSHPNRVDVRSNLGAAFSRLGRYEEAIEQYKKALVLDGNNQTIHFNLALAYYKAAWFTEAAGELTALLDSAPKDFPQRPNAVLLLADCEARLGNNKKAIVLLTPLADAEPDNRTVAYLLGSALISDGQVNQGQALIDRVFRDEDSAEARLLMGSILLVADDGQGAIKEFERAIQLNPKLPTLRAWYGRSLMRMGDSEKAKTAFRSELADNLNDFEANLYLSILLRQDKQFNEAFEYVSRAVRLRPRDQYARYHLAAVYFALGKPSEALPLLERVVKEYPDFSEARVLLASVYYRLNRKEDGGREKAIVEKLNAAQQAKQPGAQNKDNQSTPVKPPDDFQNNYHQLNERR